MQEPKTYQVFDLCLEFETVDERPPVELAHAVLSAVNEALARSWSQATAYHVGGELEHSIYVDGESE